MKLNLSTVLKVIFIVTLLIFSSKTQVILAQKIGFIQVESLRKHMKAIASDDTEGRMTGSDGYRKAADYTAEIFQKAGLNPGWTDEQGRKSYLQPVPFIHYDYDQSSITIRKNSKNRTFAHSYSNFVVLNPGIHHNDIPMTSPVFIGHGIHEPERNWDDYADVNVDGKWVIMLEDTPPPDSSGADFPDILRERYTDRKTMNSPKYTALMKHNVAGVIVLPDKYTSENWEIEALRKYRFNYLHYAKTDLNISYTFEPDIPFILLHPTVAQILMSGQIYNPITNRGRYQSFVLMNEEINIEIMCCKELVNCHNIIALVPGTDSLLKDEYITVGAHLDHLGKIGDHVYNGANDDASGCVIILEAAKAIASNPLRKSVLFILYTSEEQQLIGSKYFLTNLPIPINQISLNINIEQIGSKNRNYPGIWVISPRKFETAFQNASNLYNETNLKFDLVEEFGDALSTCDLWSYHEKKIPAIMLSSGGFPEHHTFHDNIELIDFEHLLVSSDFLYSFIVELGNEQQ